MSEFIDKLNSKGYTEMAEALKKYCRNAIDLFDKEYDGGIPTGASKMGGFPDLPPEIEYPTMSGYTETWLKGQNKGTVEHYEKSAMQLVAQINLYELAESGDDLENLLPKTGMLYIFWSGEVLERKSDEYSEIIAEEPDNTAIHKVIYWDGDMSTLKRTEPPCPYYSKYFEECLPEKAVEFGWMGEIDEQAASDIDGLEEALEMEAYDFSENCDKLLGFPKGGNAPYIDENRVNLFQFDHQDGCLWAVYWLMSRDDLLRKDFSNVEIDYDCD